MLFKVSMNLKIIVACLKGFLKFKKNGVFLFGISFFVIEISRFCIMQMRKVMMS